MILDEPTEGLDPVAIEDVLQIVVSLAAEGTTIFFSSHQIAEVEQVADHVLMIDRGKLVLDASMDRIKEQYRQIQAVFTDPIEERDLRLPGIEWVHVEGRTASFVASHNVDSIVEHVRMLRAGSIDVLPISLKERGSALLALGNSERSRAAFQQALAVFPFGSIVIFARRELAKIGENVHE